MGNKRKISRKKKRAQRKAILGAAFVLICTLIFIICLQLFLRSYIKEFDSHTIIQGVFIGNTDVSGQTKETAKKKIQEELSVYEKETLKLTLEDGRFSEAKIGLLGLSIKDLDTLIQDAVDYGKKGNAVSCYKILKKAEKKENEKHFPVQYYVTKKGAETTLETAMAPILKLPENARMSKSESGIEVVEESPGEVVDIKKTVSSINTFLGDEWDGKGAAVKAYVTYQDPEVTKEDLKEVTDLLGTYQTYYGGASTNSGQNIETGAKHINGILLKPGEELSANASMEPYTEENGYVASDSYEGDMVVQTMGGGICQISTTLYNAVILAELEITQRSPHSMLVTYVEPSMDAAIADDVMDLKFKNNQKTPIYIESVLADGYLTFSIYGKETRDPGRTIEYVSEITNEKEPEGKKFVATEEAAGTYYVKSNARKGIEARLWKVIYQNGEEVSREQFNYSQYMASKETIAVGTSAATEEQSAKIKNAILTQDETLILDAIQ